jgi:hypothetical protein
LIVRFEASSISAGLQEDSDPAFLEAFLTNGDRSQYLAFQRGQPFGDDEDWGVYVEVNDQGFSGYDKIALCELSNDAIRVSLATPLGRPGIVDAIEVAFAPGACPPNLVECIRSIFTGRESLLRVLDGGPAA